MKKYILNLLVLLIITISIKAQNIFPSTGNVGIGTASPVNIFTVKLNGSTPAASWLSGGSSPAFIAFGENMSTGSNVATASDIFNHRPVFNARRSRGSLALPKALVTNDFLASFVTSGYDGKNFQNPAGIDFYVDSTPTPGNVPGRISFVTGTNAGNRKERLKISSTGNFTFNSNQLFLQKSNGSVGLGTISPDPSAKLDIQSTTKGVLLPRMTVAQRNAIQNPAPGLLIYQVDAASGFYYFNSGWQLLAGSGTVAGANTSLSNLNTVAINTDLLPGTNNQFNLGSATNNWKDLNFSGIIYKEGSPFISTPLPTTTFVGTASGNQGVSAPYNTGFGISALTNISSGERNTAVGGQSLFSNTTGTNNTGVGLNAGYYNTISSGNTAIGSDALKLNTGEANTATGTYSLIYCVTGFGNTANGYQSLSYNNSGIYNVAVGFEALFNNNAGSNNVGIGFQTLAGNTDNSFNTAVGNSAGYYNAAMGTFLGAGATSTADLTNVTAIGYNAMATADNQVRIGNTSVTSIGGEVGWTEFSDGRYKKNITENVPGLEFINKLRPVTYNLDIEGIDKTIKSNVSEKPRLNDLAIRKNSPVPQAAEATARQQKTNIKYTGFIAQEVEQAANKLGYDFSGVDKPKSAKDFYGLRYGDFVVPLVKAVQELSEKAAKVDELEAKNQQLEARIAKLEALINANSSGNVLVNSDLAYLEQNIPNPSTGFTSIIYHLPANTTNAKIVIADSKGSTIKSITLNSRGNGQVSLSAKNALSFGSYTYTLYVDGKQVDSKQMVIYR